LTIAIQPILSFSVAKNKKPKKKEKTKKKTLNKMLRKRKFRLAK